MDEVVEEVDFVQIDKHIANLPFLDRQGGIGLSRPCLACLKKRGIAARRQTSHI